MTAINDNGNLRKNFLRATINDNGDVNITEVGKIKFQSNRTYYTLDLSDLKNITVKSYRYTGDEMDERLASAKNMFPSEKMALKVAQDISTLVYDAYCNYEDESLTPTQNHESES